MQRVESENETKITISDDHLIKIGFAQKSAFKTINPTDLTTKPRVEDVVQQGIGNCYFLASLAALIEQDVEKLMDLIKINADKKIEVTLYDIKDRKKIIYELDPTIIKSAATNNHTHPLIFFMEKAYAIHRMLYEKKEFIPRENLIAEELKKANGNIEIASNALYRLEEDSINVAVQKMSDFLKKVNPNTDRTNFSEEETLFFNLFEKKEFNSDLALLAYRRSFPYKGSLTIQREVKDFLTTESKQYKDFATSLTSGFSDQACISLLGTEAVTLILDKEITLEYLLKSFIPDIIFTPRKELDIPEKNILNMIFKNDEEAEKVFLNLIKKTGPKVFEDAFLEFKERNHKPDTHTFLKDLFSRLLEKNHEDYNSDIKERLSKILYDFIDEHLIHKRGLGKYTDKQNFYYQTIFLNLSEGNLVLAGTKNKFKNNTNQSKGLLAKHEYQVVNCYERKGKKYIQLRNPWGYHVRSYQYKNKIINNVPVTVLSAKEEKQLASYGILSGISQKLFDSPRNDPIENPARISDSLDKKTAGIFEVELGDILKNFSTLTHAPLPKEELRLDNLNLKK